MQQHHSASKMSSWLPLELSVECFCTDMWSKFSVQAQLGDEFQGVACKHHHAKAKQGRAGWKMTSELYGHILELHDGRKARDKCNKVDKWHKNKNPRTFQDHKFGLEKNIPQKCFDSWGKLWGNNTLSFVITLP